MDDPVIITSDEWARIAAAVLWVEQQPKGGLELNPAPASAAGAPVHFARVSSTVLVSGRYPAVLLNFNSALVPNGVAEWSDGDAIWLVPANGEVLSVGPRYQVRAQDFVNGRQVYTLARSPAPSFSGSKQTGSQTVTVPAGGTGINVDLSLNPTTYLYDTGGYTIGGGGGGFKILIPDYYLIGGSLEYDITGGTAKCVQIVQSNIISTQSINAQVMTENHHNPAPGFSFSPHSNVSHNLSDLIKFAVTDTPVLSFGVFADGAQTSILSITVTYMFWILKIGNN
jgi:hypothetical protein